MAHVADFPPRSKAGRADVGSGLVLAVGLTFGVALAAHGAMRLAFDHPASPAAPAGASQDERLIDSTDRRTTSLLAAVSPAPIPVPTAQLPTALVPAAQTAQPTALTPVAAPAVIAPAPRSTLALAPPPQRTRRGDERFNGRPAARA